MSVVIDKVLAGLSYDAATIASINVAVTSPADLDVLTYDAGTQTWIAATGGGGGITWSTPVDSNIAVDTNNVYKLGAANAGFSELYINKVFDLNGGQVMDFTTGVVLQSDESDLIFNSNATGKAVFGAEDFQIFSQLGGAPHIRFYKAGGANFLQLGISNSISTNTTYTLPLTDGSNGQFLKTNGSGVLSFATAPSLQSTQTSAPTLIAEAAAGTGATLTDISTGSKSSDQAGKLRLTTGTTGSAGTVATVTFSTPYANDCSVVIIPADASLANAIAASGGSGLYVTAISTGFSLNITDVALPDSDTFDFYYVVVSLD